MCCHWVQIGRTATIGGDECMSASGAGERVPGVRDGVGEEDGGASSLQPGEPGDAGTTGMSRDVGEAGASGGGEEVVVACWCDGNATEGTDRADCWVDLVRGEGGAGSPAATW